MGWIDVFLIWMGLFFVFWFGWFMRGAVEAGERADDAAEELMEQILRREP